MVIYYTQKFEFVDLCDDGDDDEDEKKVCLIQIPIHD